MLELDIQNGIKISIVGKCRLWFMEEDEEEVQEDTQQEDILEGIDHED